MTLHFFETCKIYWWSCVDDKLCIYVKWHCLQFITLLHSREFAAVSYEEVCLQPPFTNILAAVGANQWGVFFFFFFACPQPFQHLQTGWSQPGWKCVKTVKGVWCTPHHSASSQTWFWPEWSCAGCFDRRWMTWCPKPTVDHISRTSAESFKATHAPNILEILRVLTVHHAKLSHLVVL